METNKLIAGVVAIVVTSSLVGCDSGDSGGATTSSNTLTLGQSVSGTTETKTNYKMSVTAGHAYGVQLETTLGDANVFVYDGAPSTSPTEVAHSSVDSNFSTKEATGFVASTSGIYYVSVTHVGGFDLRSNFNLLVTDNSVNAKVNYSGDFYDQPVYYRFDSNGTAFTVVLTIHTGEADLQVWDGPPQDAASQKTGSFLSGGDTVTISNPTSTPYYIEVTPKVGSEQATNYTLSVTQ